MREVVCQQQNCTLCMACANACPKEAIFLTLDENGYEKIAIDSEKCVDCGICEKVCKERNAVLRKQPISCYAAQAKDEIALGKSASGGVFQMLAETVLEKQGICYGCELVHDEGKYLARHVRIHEKNELFRILNSKYIPSITGKAYKEVQKDLQAGRLVLFSGTPCQIQGLKALLGKEYENLLTVDLICHGVGSSKMFDDYIRCLEQKDSIKIVEYMFRDKKISWGTNYCYYYYRLSDPQKRIRRKSCPREESSYMMHYLRGNLFRDNCYTCTLANTDRVGDFTAGDYWEIEREHPEFITQGENRIILRKGVSCILANTEKAKQYIDALKEKMIMHEVSLESIVSHNGNLRRPSKRGNARERILDMYKSNGYVPIEERYRRTVGSKIYLYRLKNYLKAYLPDKVRIAIYRSPFLSKIIFH